MHEWEFVATVRIIVAAHCEEDAREAVVDALDECVTGVESITLVGGPGPSLSIVD